MQVLAAERAEGMGFKTTETYSILLSFKKLCKLMCTGNIWCYVCYKPKRLFMFTCSVFAHVKYIIETAI